MPIFKVTFERDVRQTDRFVRFIEAESRGAADALADQMASEADDNCPDDAAPFGGDECDSWDVHDIETPTTAEIEAYKAEAARRGVDLNHADVEI